MLIIKYIEKIHLQAKKLKEQHDMYFEDSLLFAYRGEEKDYGSTKLIPSIFRKTIEKQKILEKERHLFELMHDYNIIDVDSKYIEKAIEAQHYVAISRMLDITFNVLVSIYFACRDTEIINNKELTEDEIQKEIEKANITDGCVYVFGFPKYFSPHSEYIEKFYNGLLSGNRNVNDNCFKVFTHSRSNERIIAQNGGFVFFPQYEFCEIDNCYYRTIIIEKADKIQLLKELKETFGVSLDTQFPTKETRAEEIKIKAKQSTKDGYEIKIEEYIEKLNYELTMNTEITLKNKLRILRSEKNAINNNIKDIIDENKIIDSKFDEKSIREKVNKSFDELIYKYQEGI